MPDLDALLTSLAAALAEEGPAVRFTPGHLGEPAETGIDGAAVVVNTSGSTGTPKSVVLTGSALAASSMATAVALRGEGQWLLALPLEYVAGVQVLVRSLYAGTRPWAMDLSEGFTVAGFVAAAQELTDPIRFTSLVPTQLQRLLDDPTPQTLAVLQRFNAILLGGAASPPGLLTRAHDLGIRVVTTYGAAETAGGCVYDGYPLEDVHVRIVDGRIHLGGPTLAAAYLNDPQASAQAFTLIDEEPFYRTSDLGELDENGRLVVTGRVDDVVISGGKKVSASEISRALEAHDGVRLAFAGGVPSSEWGQVVLAAVVPCAEAALDPTALREALRPRFGELRPKDILILDQLPQLSNGKVDRAQLLDLLSRHHGGK